MAKKEKSQAEIYREERKARLAKAAKKNAKNLSVLRQVKPQEELFLLYLFWL